MIIGTIKQQGTLLITETNEIAYQYASNLQLSVEFMDGFFNGYSLVWLFAYDKDSPKTGILLYDSVQKKLTLPPEAFEKDGRLYISMRALKDDVVIPTSPVEFYITQTLNPDATNIPHEAGWEEIAKNLIEQVFENEYKQVMEQLKKSVDDTVNDVKEKLENGDFIGPLGPQGLAIRQCKKTLVANAKFIMSDLVGVNPICSLNDLIVDAIHNVYQIVDIQYNPSDKTTTYVVGDILFSMVGPQGTSFKYQGVWVVGKVYINNATQIDTVTYNGEAYVCIKTYTSSASITPETTGYWLKMVSKGINGKTVNLRSNGDFVQYQHEGDTAWTNLFNINQIQGMDAGWGKYLYASGPYTGDLNALMEQPSKILYYRTGSTNYPGDLKEGILFNLSYTASASYGKQLVFDINTGTRNTMYMRTLAGGAWSPWLKIINQNDFNGILNGKLDVNRALKLKSFAHDDSISFDYSSGAIKVIVGATTNVPVFTSNRLADFTISGTTIVVNPGGLSYYDLPVPSIITGTTNYVPCIIASNGDLATSDFTIIGTSVNVQLNRIRFVFNVAMNYNIRINYLIFYKG